MGQGFFLDVFFARFLKIFIIPAPKTVLEGNRRQFLFLGWAIFCAFFVPEFPLSLFLVLIN
jgi:hypothetical protein